MHWPCIYNLYFTSRSVNSVNLFCYSHELTVLELFTYHIIFDQLLELEHALLPGENGGVTPWLEGFFARCNSRIHFIKCRLWHPSDHFICGLRIKSRENKKIFFWLRTKKQWKKGFLHIKLLSMSDGNFFAVTNIFFSSALIAYRLENWILYANQ